MKRLATTIAIALLALACGPAAAQAEFGLYDFDVTFQNEDGSTATQAGAHPFAMNTSFGINFLEEEPGDWQIEGRVKDIFIPQIPGLVIDTTAYPRCPSLAFLQNADCPPETQIGVTATAIGIVVGASPLFNLTPPPGTLLRFGWNVVGNANVVIDIKLNTEAPHNGMVASRNTPQVVDLGGVKTQLWGDPADPSHDPLRPGCLKEGSLPDFPLEDPGSFEFESTSDACSITPNPKAFLTVPTSCIGAPFTTYQTVSWEGEEDSGGVQVHDAAGNPRPFTGCAKLGFTPKVDSKPTSESAESGTGLNFTVGFEDEGLANVGGLAESQVKKTVVTLPEGVTINPSVAEGLDVCRPEQIERETLASQAGEGCPNGSKLGAVRVLSPLIDQALEGPVFLAQQDDPSTATPGQENPFDSLIALYMVLRNTNLGMLIKLPLKVEPDPVTGQLVTTLEEAPQLPFSSFEFRFKEGARAPLVTPPRCGTYTTEAKLYPWSDPTNPRPFFSSFEVTSGVGDGPCPPGGVPPFQPDFEAGALNNNAGSFSPFVMRLLRSDGEQDMTKFSSVLPPGQVGSLVGVAKCPDAAVAVARQKTGREELASPSCPANSRIGRTLAGAGVGGALTYVGGQLYLAGPYKGAPLSVISVTSAVAGPFDAGTVVVRLGLTLNPKTAEVEVDGSASDPIPHILEGIVLKVRDLRVYVDRPNFILNPTSCQESSARATLFGSYLDVFSPADDLPAHLSTRYQAANCANLGFKPRLALKLTGGTKRGSHPGLLATYRPRPGDANAEGVTVRLPSSAFLDQSHIRTICTRVQFAADACPAAAQYGYITAHTPLLEEPLQGPVWLRSSDHKLPDLVFDLQGLVDIEVVARIDSARGGIRSSLSNLPDAPLTKVVLRMQGGKKGLIVNSRNLCAKPSRANVSLRGQNGKRHRTNPLMEAECSKGRKGKRRGKR